MYSSAMSAEVLSLVVGGGGGRSDEGGGGGECSGELGGVRESSSCESNVVVVGDGHGEGLIFGNPRWDNIETLVLGFGFGF